MSYSTEVLADSPLAYYRLGEASGTTMVDSSGNGRDGTYSGTVTAAAPGLPAGDSDTARDFGGGFGRVPLASWMQTTTGMTAECWFKADAVNSDRPLITRTDWNESNSSSARAFHLMVKNGALGAQVAGGFASVEKFTTGGISPGVIYHAALVYNASTMQVYLNGVEVISSPAALGSLHSAVAPLGVGTDSVRTYGRFDGVIDEVAYYGTALSAARIAAHYAAGTAATVITGTLAATLPRPLS